MAVSITDRTNALSINPFQHTCVTSSTDAGNGASYTATYGSTRSLARNLSVVISSQQIVAGDVPLSTQTRHTDPFKERFEALSVLPRGLGLGEVVDMGDVHVRLVSHARRHVFDRVRLGDGVVHGCGRTCPLVRGTSWKESLVPHIPTYATRHRPSPPASLARSQTPIAAR